MPFITASLQQAKNIRVLRVAVLSEKGADPKPKSPKKSAALIPNYLNDGDKEQY
jgi:hypothetical protein